jgi:hypothetical protein
METLKEDKEKKERIIGKETQQDEEKREKDEVTKKEIKE